MKKAVAILALFLVLSSSLVFAGGSKETAKTGEPYTVNIQMVGLFEANENLQNVEDAVNAIMVPKVNAKVHLMPTFIGDLPRVTSMGVAGGEKMDLVVVGLTQKFASAVADGLLLPLDDLLKKYGKDILKVTEKVADAQKINGTTYAISGYAYAAVSGGMVYNKDMADKWGLNIHNHMTFDELTAVGEELKKHGVYLTTFGNSSNMNFQFSHAFDQFGTDAVYGAIMDPVKSTKVENVYNSEQFRAYHRTVKTWADNGYLPKDQLTDTTTTQELFSQQKIFMTSTAYTPDQIAAWLQKDFTAALIYFDDPIILGGSGGGATEMMYGIASNCKNPEAAMKVLNVIYSDPAVCNLLQYGVEGHDYKAVPGTKNVITYEGTPNVDHSQFFFVFMHMGDPDQRKIMAPLTDNYLDECKAFNKAAKTSKAFGYNFDGEAYSAEAGAISAILQEKLPQLNAGLVADADKAIDELVRLLDNAGMKDVIAANQKQLDAYLKGKK